MFQFAAQVDNALRNVDLLNGASAVHDAPNPVMEQRGKATEDQQKHDELPATNGLGLRLFPQRLFLSGTLPFRPRLPG